MRSKRVLTLLLAVCMLFSCIAPASAVQPGSESAAVEAQSRSVDSLNSSASDSRNLTTLRDGQDNADSGVINDAALPTGFGTGAESGYWSATLSDTDVSVDLTNAALPSFVQELRQAAEKYAAGEKVTAFVILEEMPLVQTYSSIQSVPQSATEILEVAQNQLVQTMSETVDLEVVDSFTYLANAIVVETAVENLEEIAMMDGVKSVFISPVFYPCETDMSPYTVSSGEMTDVNDVWNTEGLGYTGEGMTIAILDTGLDLDHPSFAAAPAGAAWTVDYVTTLLENNDLRAEELYGDTLTADDLYYSAKVPFAFNYALGNTAVGHNDGAGDHGTHVAGIAAANEVEGTGVVGMAPDAQIIVMKVFQPTGGANMYDILNALEDCMRLGVDVANLSLGSAAGFSNSGADEIDKIFASIATTDLIVDVAAGNEGTSAYGSLWGNYLNTTENMDTATVGSPSTYVNSLSIASVDNKLVYSAYFVADDTKIFYQPSVEYLYGETNIGLPDLAGEELEYVIVPGLGSADNFYSIKDDVEGKVAVVKRGTLSFSEKVANAEAYGAKAVLIWNNNSEDDIFTFGMSVVTEDKNGTVIYAPSIPVALISLDDGQKMADAEDKTMTVSATDALRVDPHGAQLSSFSSWGVSPDLTLLPDIAGVGGNVYSCYDGGYYGLMSGTSMATPQIAGVTALVLQYIEKNDLTTETGMSTRELVDALMMSTAVPVVDTDTELEASPRQQGAGLVNALNAVTAEAYLSVNGGRPKASLGDNTDGSYSFTFTVHNFSDTAKTYTLSSSLLSEAYTIDANYPGVYFMAEQEHALANSTVSFSANSVTVGANSTATITVTIELDDADMDWINKYFPNGNYVEGFVYLTDANGVDLSLPFLGFYGNWNDAPLFDHGYWYEESFWVDNYDEVQAHQYWTVPWLSLGSTDWVLGFNPYTGALTDTDGKIIYNKENNVVSPNGDGLVDSIVDFYISLMRNAKDLYLTYTDAGDNVVDKEKLPHAPKTMYNSNYGQTVPFIYSWYSDSLYDFTDGDGNVLPDGTELTLTISGKLDGEEALSESVITIPVSVDLTAPVLDTTNIVPSSDENGNYLTLTFTDAHPAYAVLMNPAGTQTYTEYGDADFVDNGDGIYSVTVDVTDLGDKFMIALCDYGCNEAYYDLTWTESDNNPEMDDSLLYAYQVYHELYYQYYGYDYMFGWSAIDKETAEVTMLNSDAYEYWALTAAEYAGGYIFAVDAGYNFLYMVPGLWNRNIICNIGLNVVDMAFDEVTKTMYLVTKDSDNGDYCLYTIDLLTGDTTLLRDYGGQYSMPWVMTFVDGKLYCSKYYYNGLYTIDLEGKTYDLTQVTLEDGSNFLPTTSSGKGLSPMYSQSMTYSKADGKIYWAYYGTNGQALVTIDPKTLDYTYTPFSFVQEYVGVLTLEDDGYTIPASAEVTKVVLSDESLILSVGSKYTLTANLLPWNAVADDELTWSSDDATVATVVDGVITAVGEGSAEITVSYGDGSGNLTATCTVNVVDVQGTLNAYKYVDGDENYGDWLDIDLETVTEKATVASPVDFLAADYNGHSKLIYGYDEVGQCYWFNPATEEYGKLGTASVSNLPADMAYDYKNGLMYTIVPDYSSFSTNLYLLNMSTGALVEVTTLYGEIFMTLACDTDGMLYGINISGMLYELPLTEGSSGDGGIGGWEPLGKPGISLQSVGDGVTEYSIMPEFLLQTPVPELFYAQTMCYDHNNDVLLWISAEYSTIYWIDGLGADEKPFVVELGDPSGTGLIEYTGAYVVPTVIPELEDVAISMVKADDMMLLAGASKAPTVNIYPANATVQTVDSWSSSDEDVAYVDANGMVVGVKEGSATITAIVVDTKNGNTEHEAEFTVTVKNPTDNIYGYLMSDLANYDGYYWMGIDDADPSAYTPLDYAYYNGAYLTIWAAEYVDGTIYAYGYDDQDWNANFQFLTIDPKTWSVKNAIDMGDGFPFVYDMAFDYTTGAMYALAGASDNITDLYYVNMETGELILCTATGADYMFLGLTVDADGTIYAMANSVEEMDWDTWMTTLSNAQLYTIDPATGAIEWFLDAGTTNNQLTTMAYDHDTGYIYWNALDSSYNSAFCLIDPAEKAVYKLGTVGGAGAQVTGLMVIADEYPELPDTLVNMTLTSTLEELTVDDTVELETFVLPFGVDVEMTWESSDESVATVDANGVVTGVAPGEATITVTVVDSEDNEKTATCTIVVYGDNDFFFTYNTTDAGISAVARPDSTTVINLTEGETDPAVTAMTVVNGYIYAYDENNDLFVTFAGDKFARTYIGNAGIEVDESYVETTTGYYNYHTIYTPAFQIRDLAWDEANGRLLALGCYVCYEDVTMTSEYYNDAYTNMLEETGGCRVYEVDITTGELTELFTVQNADGPESGVYMLTVTADGQAYAYSCYFDYVMKLDLETGLVTNLSTFQNQGVYGSSDGDPMSMTYDPVTGNLYLLFTQNGNSYFLYKFDLVTWAISLVGDMGKDGDAFAGLALNEKHVCDEKDYILNEHVDATCTEDGYDTYVCPQCGEGSYTETIPATGHSYVLVAGTTYVCDDCGFSYAASVTTTPTTPSTEPSTGSTTTTVENEDGTVTETTTTVETVENEDGSTTTTTTTDTTVTDAEGNVLSTTNEVVEETVTVDEEGNETVTTTATTTTELANGTIAVTVANDGVVTEASVALPESDGTVTLPISELPADSTSETAAVITVSAPAETEMTIEIPVTDATAGTIVVLVHEDGAEEIISTTTMSDDGVKVTISGDVTVKVIDNTPEFNDVGEDDWHEEAVIYATARGVFNQEGVGNDNFAPDGDMTRAMVFTTLARFAGVDTEGGETWYEKGMEWAVENNISDGTNPDDAVTREQVVTMLYRLVGEPETTGEGKTFTDSGDISTWAADAMAWAVEIGLIGGYPDGGVRPTDTATRAEVATIFMRFIEATAK